MIQELLDQYEVIKQKAFQCTEHELLELINIQDRLIDIEYTNGVNNETSKVQVSNKKAQKFTMLKEQLNDLGKKVHTDKTAQATIDQEYENEDIEYITNKFELKLIGRKIESIKETINFIKKLLYKN